MKPNTTNDTDDITDEPGRAPISRRNLMRGTAAGALALGSLRLPEQYRPVGQAQAVPWVPVLAGFALGMGAYAGWNYMTGGNAEDVQESAATWAIYNAFAAATTSRQNAIAYHADDYGVDISDRVPGFDRGDGQHSPNDNELMHAVVEHYTAEAAASWSRGDTVIEAQQRARDEANMQLASAEWSVVALHNDAVSAALPAMSDHYDTFGSGSNSATIYDDAGSGKQTPTPIGWGETHIDAIGTPTSYGGDSNHGLIGVRDITDELPIDPDDLPPAEQPDNGFTLLEPAFVGEASTGTRIRIMTPYAHIIDETPSTDVTGGDDVDMQDFSVTHRDDRIFVEDPESERQLTYDFWVFAEMLAAIREIGDRVRSDLDQTVQIIYDELGDQTIEIGDVISGRQLYQRYQPADDQSRAMIQLASYGSVSAPDQLTSTTISIDGVQHTGTLFIEADTELELDAGDTLTDADYARAHLLPDQAGNSPQVFEAGETIDIVEIEGDEPLSYSPRQRYQADGPDPAELEAELAASQERYEDLMERIEELESSAFPFGGGLGIDEAIAQYGIIAVVAAAIALLISR